MDMKLCPVCAPAVISSALANGVDVLNADDLNWFIKRSFEKGCALIADDQTVTQVGGTAVLPFRNEGIYCRYHRALSDQRRELRLEGNATNVYTPPGVA